MTNIYILTKEGKAWGHDGMDYLRTKILPKLGLKPEDTQAVMGIFYNDPSLMARELTEHPDSFIILSYEHIEVFPPDTCKGFIDMFNNEANERTSWQIIRDLLPN